MDDLLGINSSSSIIPNLTFKPIKAELFTGSAPASAPGIEIFLFDGVEVKCGKTRALFSIVYSRTHYLELDILINPDC